VKNGDGNDDEDKDEDGLVGEGLSGPPSPAFFGGEGGESNWLWFQSISRYFPQGERPEIISYLKL
jgi:hypothetical protein